MLYNRSCRDKFAYNRTSRDIIAKKTSSLMFLFKMVVCETRKASSSSAERNSSKNFTSSKLIEFTKPTKRQRQRTLLFYTAISFRARLMARNKKQTK